MTIKPIDPTSPDHLREFRVSAMRNGHELHQVLSSLLSIIKAVTSDEEWEDLFSDEINVYVVDKDGGEVNVLTLSMADTMQRAEELIEKIRSKE